MTKTPKSRKYIKFVALDRRGNPLWGTLCTTATEAQERHDKFNPDPTGQGMEAVISEVRITVKIDK